MEDARQPHRERVLALWWPRLRQHAPHGAEQHRAHHRPSAGGEPARDGRRQEALSEARAGGLADGRDQGRVARDHQEGRGRRLRRHRAGPAHHRDRRCGVRPDRCHHVGSQPRQPDLRRRRVRGRRGHHIAAGGALAVERVGARGLRRRGPSWRRGRRPPRAARRHRPAARRPARPRAAPVPPHAEEIRDRRGVGVRDRPRPRTWPVPPSRPLRASGVRRSCPPTAGSRCPCP